MQFRDLYCIRYGCDVSEFERDFVRRYISAPLPALGHALLRHLPDYFVEEHVFAQYVGKQVDSDGIQLEVDLYHAKCVDLSFVRKWLGLRMRCRTMMQDANLLMAAWREQKQEAVTDEHPQGRLVTIGHTLREPGGSGMNSGA